MFKFLFALVTIPLLLIGLVLCVIVIFGFKVFAKTEAVNEIPFASDDFSACIAF